MKHRIVTAAQMKEIERAGNAHGLPYLQMMENAGLAAYTQLRARFARENPACRCTLLCGDSAAVQQMLLNRSEEHT